MVFLKNDHLSRPFTTGAIHQRQVHDLLGSFELKSIHLGVLTAGLTEFNYLYFIQSKTSLVVTDIIVLFTTKKGKHAVTQYFLIP